MLENFSDQFLRVPTNNNNKQVGVRLGLECHLIFNLLLLLSGVHGVGDGDCAVGRTKSILAKEKSSRAGLTEQVVGVVKIKGPFQGRYTPSLLLGDKPPSIETNCSECESKKYFE